MEVITGANGVRYFYLWRGNIIQRILYNKICAMLTVCDDQVVFNLFVQLTDLAQERVLCRKLPVVLKKFVGWNKIIGNLV